MQNTVSNGLMHMQFYILHTTIIHSIVYITYKCKYSAKLIDLLINIMYTMPIDLYKYKYNAKLMHLLIYIMYIILL